MKKRRRNFLKHRTLQNCNNENYNKSFGKFFYWQINDFLMTQQIQTEMKKLKIILVIKSTKQINTHRYQRQNSKVNFLHFCNNLN